MQWFKHDIGAYKGNQIQALRLSAGSEAIDLYYAIVEELYETEERLCGAGFLRISKSCLVNLRYIRSLRSELDRRLRLTLENGEQIIVSRQYSDDIKTRLGVRQ